MDNSFYVYVLLDPRKPGKYIYREYSFEYEPFYIGKGHGGRVNYHLTNYDLENGVNPHRRNKIKKILKFTNKKEIPYKITECSSEEEAFKLEKYFICLIGRKDLGKGPLVNMTDGGEGATGHIVSEKQKRYMSDLKRKYTYEEFLEVLDTVGYEFVEGEYTSGKSKIKVRCKSCGKVLESIGAYYLISGQYGECECKGYERIQKWSKEEDDLIREYYPVVGKKMLDRLNNRSHVSLVSRANRLGVYSPYGWSKEDEKKLELYFPDKSYDELLKMFPNRTYGSIAMKASQKGIKNINCKEKWSEEADEKIVKNILSPAEELYNLFECKRSKSAIRQRVNYIISNKEKEMNIK